MAERIKRAINSQRTKEKKKNLEMKMELLMSSNNKDKDRFDFFTTGSPANKLRRPSIEGKKTKTESSQKSSNIIAGGQTIKIDKQNNRSYVAKKLGLALLKKTSIFETIMKGILKSKELKAKKEREEKERQEKMQEEEKDIVDVPMKSKNLDLKLKFNLFNLEPSKTEDSRLLKNKEPTLEASRQSKYKGSYYNATRAASKGILTGRSKKSSSRAPKSSGSLRGGERTKPKNQMPQIGYMSKKPKFIFKLVQSSCPPQKMMAMETYSSLEETP